MKRHNFKGFTATHGTERKHRAPGSIGSRAKAYTTALGKVIMAFSPPSVVDLCLNGELKQNTPYTHTNPHHIRTQLRDIAHRRYAVDDQENVLGVRCVGAPIFDRKSNVVAAISMSGLAVHITDARLRQLVGPLRQAAASISRRMGYSGQYLRESDPAPSKDGHQLTPLKINQAAE